MAKDKVTPKETLSPLAKAGDGIDRIVRSAVKNALRKHKLAGNSIAIWRDGKVVILNPSEISL